MAIRDQIVGFLLTSDAEFGDRAPFVVNSGDDLMVGAVSNLVLPAKSFRRATQNDPVGVTRRAATLGLNEMRITGQLRIWSPDVISMFGTDRYGGETRGIEAISQGDAQESDDDPTKGQTEFVIRIVLEGYHLSRPRAAFIKFSGVWDEFPEITLAPDQEETPVPFGVDIHTYSEWYTDSLDITKQTLAESVKMFHYNAHLLELSVRRVYDPSAKGDEDLPSGNMWAHRRAVFGIN